MFQPKHKIQNLGTIWTSYRVTQRGASTLGCAGQWHIETRGHIHLKSGVISFNHIVIETCFIDKKTARLLRLQKRGVRKDLSEEEEN